MRPKEKKKRKKLVNQQFISFTIYHWLSLNFNNQIRSWVVQQNSRSYAVSKLKPADVKKIWLVKQRLTLIQLSP